MCSAALIARLAPLPSLHLNLLLSTLISLLLSTIISLSLLSTYLNLDIVGVVENMSMFCWPHSSVNSPLSTSISLLSPRQSLSSHHPNLSPLFSHHLSLHLCSTNLHLSYSIHLQHETQIFRSESKSVAEMCDDYKVKHLGGIPLDQNIAISVDNGENFFEKNESRSIMRIVQR